MSRLIDTQLPAARKRHLRHETVALVLHRRASDAMALHLGDERLHVVTHQIELVDVVLLGRMNGHFSRRESEDQPAATNVDVRQLEHIAQECAIRFGIGAVDSLPSDRRRRDEMSDR